MNDLNENIIAFDDINRIAEREGEVTVRGVAVVLCLQGHAQFYIDGELHEIGEKGLFICRPNLVMGRSMASGDFRFCGIGISLEFLHRLDLLSINAWDAKMFLDRNTVLSLKQEEVEVFKEYHALIRSKLSAPPIKQQERLMESLLMAFMYELHDIFTRFWEFEPIGYTAAEGTFKKFVSLLEVSFPKDRSVAFYADRLCVSPKYLSVVSKKVSGLTASELINEYVLKDVRRLLSRPEKTIKEISHELGFPNISFFGKYVKQHLGKSPRQWRETNKAEE